MAFEEEDMAIDEGTGYPRAFAKLCKDRFSVGLYSSGPPFSFVPFALYPDEISRGKKLEEVFPITDPKAKPTVKPQIFTSILWKQLNHLGNAGFDPAVIRVDPFGNVLYIHADKASPLAWEIDHWFPRCRGGLTVPSNLRIVQWQVCKRKHNKLEFLIPWWDLHIGISVNQFLSIFTSSNSDFRKRGFSFLFANGENEEVNDSIPVQSHNFPQHFAESRKQLGLAPAAIVTSKSDRRDASLALSSVDLNRQSINGKYLSGNGYPMNPQRALVKARDSFKMIEEIENLEESNEVMIIKNEQERATIQDLELQLIKHKRKAEKCRRLAESQESYKAMLEKMIRDAMHQTVVYKEQIRVIQASTTALSARLEAQKAILDSSERDLQKKFSRQNDLDVEIKNTYDPTRKRLRQDHEEDTVPKQHQLQVLNIDEGNIRSNNILLLEAKPAEVNDDEKQSNETERGKGNVEKWLQFLLENSEEKTEEKPAGDIIKLMDEKFPLIDEKSPKQEKIMKRSESAKTLRRIPSSPLLQGMKNISKLRFVKPIKKALKL